MNPYQIAGIIAGCSLAFAAVVTLLVMQGMPVMLAFLSVYAVALLSMVAMQRRARQSCAEQDERDRLAHAGMRGAVRPRDSEVDHAPPDAAVGIEPMRAAVGYVTVRY